LRQAPRARRRGPSASLAPSAAGSTYSKYASPAAFGRRLAAGPFSSLCPARDDLADDGGRDDHAASSSWTLLVALPGAFLRQESPADVPGGALQPTKRQVTSATA